jgi:hypothetical protein
MALNFGLTPQLIKRVIPQADLVAVKANYPLLVIELSLQGGRRQSVLNALATISVECPSFIPQREYGSESYFREQYGDALGRYVDGFPEYAGRGLIQLSWWANYKRYGELIGVDLEKIPDLALNPQIACRILAQFFKQNRLLDEIDPHAVRQVVNGGVNGLDDFLDAYHQFDKLMIRNG